MTVWRNIARITLSALMLFSATVLVSADVAYADPLPSSITAGGSSGGNPARSDNLEVRDGDGRVMKCSDYGALTGAIVPCIMHIIETTGMKFAEEFADMMEYAVGAFLTLTVIFFGVKTLQGEGQVAQKAVLMVVKIAFVLGFLQIMPSLIPMVHAIMKEGTTIVADSLANQDDFHCEYTVKPGGDLLWAQMDCLIGKLFGFMTSENGQPNMLLAASGFGLLGGFLFGGTFGLFVFFAILGVLFTLLNFIWKTLLAYINGFIVATLLIILAPIFLPLSLMQATAQYFDKWWKGILAAILMPIVITGYVALALMLYDKVLLAPDSLVQNLFNKDVMAEMQHINEQICLSGGTNDQAVNEGRAQADNISPEQRSTFDAVANRIFPLMTGNQGSCVSHPSLQVPTDMLEGIFIDLIKLVITSIVIGSGFSAIQGLVRNITGSSMVSSAIEPVSTLETNLRDSMHNARSAMEQEAAATGSGTEFVSRLPEMVRAGVEGFMGQRLGLTARQDELKQQALGSIEGYLRATDGSVSATQRSQLEDLQRQLESGQVIGNPVEAVNRIMGRNTR